MATPHKHAALIKAWADGAEIEYSVDSRYWEPASGPLWDRNTQYRIKPVPTPADVIRAHVEIHHTKLAAKISNSVAAAQCNVEFIFNGDTGKLEYVALLQSKYPS